MTGLENKIGRTQQRIITTDDREQIQQASMALIAHETARLRG